MFTKAVARIGGRARMNICGQSLLTATSTKIRRIPSSKPRGLTGQSLYFSSHSVWFSSWLRRNMGCCSEGDIGVDIGDDLKVIPLYRSALPRIPDDLINRKPKAYKPHAISLGPLHLGDSHFEDYKRKKQQLLEDRFPYRFHRFNELVDSITGMDDRIRQWYPISDPKTFQEPGKMMALDGLFLLECLREISPIPDDERSVNLPEIQELIDREDFPNLKENVTRKFQEQLHALTNQAVHEDILKLQNQIPLFALEMIIQWEEKTYEAVRQTMPQQEESEEKKTMLQDIMLQARRGTNQDLDKILRRAWHDLSPFVVGEDPPILRGENAHILGYVYENILGESTDLTQYKGKGNRKKILPATAVLLDKKGVKFAAYSGPLHKIRFDRKTGTLHLPRIEIAERTDAVMRNLVAFEFYGCGGQTKPIKCYVELMDQLINTAEDVVVLKNHDIIHHHLGTDQEVADIWNKMRKGYDQKGKYGPIDTAIEEVINFYGSYRIWFSEGVKKFFSKPWLVVSFIAGFIVVITAILQTIFSLLQFYHH